MSTSAIISYRLVPTAVAADCETTHHTPEIGRKATSRQVRLPVQLVMFQNGFGASMALLAPQ